MNGWVGYKQKKRVNWLFYQIYGGVGRKSLGWKIEQREERAHSILRKNVWQKQCWEDIVKIIGENTT